MPGSAAPSPPFRTLPAWPVVQCSALLLAAVLLAAGCSSAPPRSKRSFVGQTDNAGAPERVPVGLNPLGGVDTCNPDAPAPADKQRVLISRPEFFSQPASQMIAALRDALAEHRDSRDAIVLLLSREPLTNRYEALEEGEACQAVVVLWEPRGTRTLDLLLPQPERIPLRNLVRRQLCEFGDYQEQLNSLFFTILGLVATREARYDRAVFYFESANRVDDRCLRLPGTPRPGAP